MLDDPAGLRRMAHQCRSLALTRQTEELRNVFLQMAERYDLQAVAQEGLFSPVEAGSAQLTG